MISLCIKTDQAEAYVGLYEDEKEVASESWHAHKALSDTLLLKIDTLLKREEVNYKQVNKIVVYAGPGSYTGLRIGVSTANALGYSLGIPVLAVSGDDWIAMGQKSASAEFVPQVPNYGGEPHITQAKK